MSSDNVRACAGSGIPVRRRIALLCGAAALLCLQGRSAMAQEAPLAAPAAAAPATVGEIIVTAQRRAERLIDVPVSISAFSSDAIKSRGITNVDGLEGLAPNLKFSTGGGAVTASFPVIRGGQVGNALPYAEPAVGVYVDGVYIAKALGASVDLADIDHIEVLRGPQGTLYGRNSLGAVNFVTAAPTGAFGGNLTAGLGDYGQRKIGGNLNLDAIGPLKLKFSARYENRDGFIKAEDSPYLDAPSIFPPQPRSIDHFGSKEDFAARVAARLEPTANLKIDYAYEYDRIHATPNYLQPANITAGGIFDPTSAAYVGVPIYLYVRPDSRSSVGYGTSGVNGEGLFERSTVHAHSLTATWDLGVTTLKSITSYRTMDFGQALDLDGTPYPLAQSGISYSYRAFSEELQAIGHAGDFQYVAGIYYFHDRTPTLNPQQFFGTATTTDSRYTPATDVIAGYAQVDYKPEFAPGLTVTLGGRYSSEKRSLERYLAYVDNATGATLVAIPDGTSASARFHAFTPTAILRYEINPTFNVYAKYARGFRSGGFTGDATNVTDATTPYQPQKVDSYELGLKGRFAEGRLEVNADVFIEKSRGIQILQFTGLVNGVAQSRYINAGDATIRGLELEVQARPFSGLTLSGGLGCLDSEFTRFIENGVDTRGEHVVPMAPKLTANFSVNAELWRFAGGEVLRLQADYLHSTKSYAIATADPFFQLDAYHLVNASLRLTDIPSRAGKLEVSVWAKNIFDQEYRTYGLDFGPSFGGFAESLYGDPRTFGAELRLSF